MEVKKIVEGMTAVEVAEVIDSNFKNQNQILEDDIQKQNNAIGVSEYQAFSEAESVAVGAVRLYNGVLYECVEATTGAFDASKWKVTSFKKETEAKLSELESKVYGVAANNLNFSNKQYPWTPGSIATDGALRTYTQGEDYMRTDYIETDGISKIFVRNGFNNQYISVVAFYDKDKKFISSPTLMQGASVSDYSADIEIPSDASYMAFTSLQSKLTEISFSWNIHLSLASNRTDTIETKNQIKSCKEEIEAIKSDITFEKNVSEDSILGRLNSYAYKDEKTFFANDYTGKYYYTLLKLSADKAYKIYQKKVVEDATIIAGFISKEEDFVVGGKINEVIIGGGSNNEVVEIAKHDYNSLLVILGTETDIFEYCDVVELNSDINQIISSIAFDAPSKLCCPDTLYAVVGKEFNLYYDSLIKSIDKGLQSPLGVYVDIQCPTLQNASVNIGVRRERMWQIQQGKLTSSYIGEHSLQITAYDNKGNQVDRKTVKLIVSDNSSSASQKNILCIGDSLTNNGPIVSTCAEHFNENGGVQPNFIGQRTTSGYKHEGYPGYTFGSFVTSGSANAYFIFDIPEGTSVSVGDSYSTNGSTYTVTDIRTEGQDNALRLRCTRNGSTMPSSTGTLTKVSGASSSPSSINYSAFEAETGNPFWDTETSSVNFTKYREKMGMDAEKFDVVVIMLGTNDCIGNIKASMLPSVNNAKTLINAILSDAADYPTKIVLQITPADANTISSWQVYSDIMGDGRKIGYWTNLWNLRNLLYDEFAKEEWKDKVYLGQAALGLDRYYGYPYTEVESSARISNVKEVYHTNSVHPNNEGYQQLGDGYYLQIKSLL